MRVLLTTDPIGGVWTFTRELSQELLRLGYHVHLVSFGRELSQAQTDWCVRTADWARGSFSWQASDVPLEWMQGNAQTWERGVAILQDAIAAFAPDVLHTSQFCFGAVDAKVPRVITAHSDVLSWAEACRPAGLETSRWLSTYCELVNRGLQAATAVAAPSRWMADTFSRLWKVERAVQVIPNGLSLASISAKESRKLQAVSAGRLWDEGKGLETLLERDWPVPMLVAGEESFGDAHLTAGSGMLALGMLSEEAMLGTMRESAIYIATSVYEPFGLAPLEAALCGCALVLRDLPSFREIWGEAALYFADADGLFETLSRLRDDAALLNTRQAAATEQAKHHSVQSMTAGYLRMYEDAIRSYRQERSASASALEFHAA